MIRIPSPPLVIEETLIFILTLRIASIPRRFGERKERGREMIDEGFWIFKKERERERVRARIEIRRFPANSAGAQRRNPTQTHLRKQVGSRYKI